MHTPTTIHPAPFPAAVGNALGQALAEAHDRVPFLPDDVRQVARRVVEVARALELPSSVQRGVVDLGGAELDHVFVVISDRVVDVAMPLRDASFVEVLRAWVAGDLDARELSQAAMVRGLEDRVLGEYPAPLRYRGAPVWGSAAA